MKSAPQMSGFEVSRQLLAGVADSVEARNRTHGGFNKFVVRYAGNACKVFGFTDEAQRFEELLSTLTPQSYWAGAITNIDTSKMPPDATELSPIPKIEKELPPFSPDYADATLRKLGGSLELCAEREYERAFDQADTELALLGICF